MTIKFVYKVEVEVAFTDEELIILEQLSGLHYDGHCRSVSQSGGFLRGMLTHQKYALEADPQAKVTHQLEFRELDTLAKILEGRGLFSGPQPSPQAERFFGVASQLYFRMHELCQAINAEYRRVNPEDP